jgi:hypothetical protein
MIMGVSNRNTQDGRLSALEAAFECAARVDDSRPSDSLGWIEATEYSKLQIQCSDIDEAKISTESTFFKPAGKDAIPVPHVDANLELYTIFRHSLKESDLTAIERQAGVLLDLIFMMFTPILRDTKQNTKQPTSERYRSLQSTTNWWKR